MKPFEKFGFKGVISSNKMDTLNVTNKDNLISFVMNLSPSNETRTHWIACYIDKNDSVEYYDSYGKHPNEEFMKNIKSLIEKLKPEVYLKFKINKIIQQRSNSKNCGFFVIRFIIDRLSGIPFKECTGYSDVVNSEKNISKFKKKLQEKFQFI